MESLKSRTENLLVSIIVVTYNSSKFVLETLESVKAQTYKNIELIVSDDCSKDNTIRVCEKWIHENKDRFIRVKIIKNPKNSGVSKNCNGGLYMCRGKWVKLIAGDDALMDNCIENFVIASKERPNVDIFYSDYIPFDNMFTKRNMKIRSPQEVLRWKYFEGLSNSLKKDALARFPVIHGPCAFINIERLKKIGGFVEKYKFVEDWPTWYRAVQFELEFGFLDEKTVKYRMHSGSITKNNMKLLSNYSIDIVQFQIQEFSMHYNVLEKILKRYNLFYNKQYSSRSVRYFHQRCIRRFLYFFVQLEYIYKNKKMSLILKKSTSRL